MKWNEIYHLLYPRALLKKDNYNAPQISFKGLTSPSMDVFNTIKQNSVMEHVDIHTFACCVENVTETILQAKSHQAR
jgi:hypothetical protein